MLVPPSAERKRKKRRDISSENGGAVISALLPVELIRGLHALAEKRGIKVSALLRDIIASNAEIMRELEDIRPLEIEE